MQLASLLLVLAAAAAAVIAAPAPLGELEKRTPAPLAYYAYADGNNPPGPPVTWKRD